MLLRTVRQPAFAQENTENISIALQFVVISVLLVEIVTRSEMVTGSRGAVFNTERSKFFHPRMSSGARLDGSVL